MLNAGRDTVEVEVWPVPVPDQEPAPSDLALLDDAERRAAASFERRADRRAYVLTHARLRRVLGTALALPPATIPIVRAPCAWCGGPHGRPEVGVGAGAVHFSLSRSGPFGIVAVAARPIGIDVEAWPDLDTVAAVTPTLHPAEQDEILSADRPGRPAAFARIWARKEAYLKGVGLGVGDDLAADYLGPDRPDLRPPGWALADIDLGPGRSGAVAAPGAVLRVALHSSRPWT